MHYIYLSSVKKKAYDLQKSIVQLIFSYIYCINGQKRFTGDYLEFRWIIFSNVLKLYFLFSNRGSRKYKYLN